MWNFSWGWAHIRRHNVVQKLMTLVLIHTHTHTLTHVEPVAGWSFLFTVIYCCAIYCITASLCRWTARMNRIKWGSITMKKHQMLEFALQLFALTPATITTHTQTYISGSLTRPIKWKHIANEHLLMNILTWLKLWMEAAQHRKHLCVGLSSSHHIHCAYVKRELRLLVVFVIIRHIA